jgi:hypothetical protein
MRYYQENAGGEALYASAERRKTTAEKVQEAAAPKNVQGALDLPDDDDVPF